METARLESLEASVVALNATVAELVAELKIVGVLSARQQQQAEAQADADVLADRRYERLTRFQWIGAVFIVLAITAGSLIAYTVLTTKVNRDFQAQRAQAFSSCNLRNETTVTIPRERELALAAQYRLDKSSSPAIAQLHQDSAEALLKATVDCSIYKHQAK